MTQVSAQTDNLFSDQDQDPEPQQSWLFRTLPFLRWTPSSAERLREAERQLLSLVPRIRYGGQYVDCSDPSSSGLDNCRIWTRTITRSDTAATPPPAPQSASSVPLVMLHGMASGLALFCLNFLHLAEHLQIYVIDVPGFARSSRCQFSRDPALAEQQFVSALETWRTKMGLNRFNLLGHSFGGYLSSAYAIQHPQRVQSLILADPWGFPGKPDNFTSRFHIPWWAKAILNVAKHFNPLAILRASGRLGPYFIPKMRPDLIVKFDALAEQDNLEQVRQAVAQYIYHCNAHSPSGETAFHTLMAGFAWARNPMLPRMHQLSPDLNVTFIYGGSSWIDAQPLSVVEEARNVTGKTVVHVLPGTGHHVYADYEIFNRLVLKACTAFGS